MEQTLYIGAHCHNIAPNVILSGDPRRVEHIITLLDEYEKVSVSREFHTYTGTYKGVPVTISSTGIGGPSAAIALEELYTAGMKVAVRLGTVMSLNDGLKRYYVPTAAVRFDGTSDGYVDRGYPAVASFRLVDYMTRSVKEHEREVDHGLVYSTQGYYTEMKESKLSKQSKRNVLQKIEELHTLNIAGMDMETATVLTLGTLMGIEACSVLLATVTENVHQSMEAEERKQEEEMLARIVLDGIVSFHKGEMTSGE